MAVTCELLTNRNWLVVNFILSGSINDEAVKCIRCVFLHLMYTLPYILHGQRVNKNNITTICKG